ncbi:MAG: SDR family oxidoreductase [Acidobacteria bacterium]|nr:SDR family oxidoreductase [Acidobacteriota bacterium]
MTLEHTGIAPDPRYAYPRPPFQAQQQEVPGDTREMDPRPDHGESSYVGSGRLRGRRALITGADSGIGRAVAIAFAREGADVALTFLPQEAEEGEEVVRLAVDAGVTVAAFVGDISEEEFSRQLVDRAAEALGGLDVLAFVAGTMPTIDGIERFETETLDRVLRTNVHSLFWITQAALPHLQPGSTIVTTSSQQGFHPSPSLVEYAVSKAGIVNWTRAMSGQLIERGIRVNGVAPGPIWTPLQPSSVPNEKIEHFGEEAPVGRPGQPAELASAYVFLASQESSYVTGETIAVTGGTVLH